MRSTQLRPTNSGCSTIYAVGFLAILSRSTIAEASSGLSRSFAICSAPGTTRNIVHELRVCPGARMTRHFPYTLVFESPVCLATFMLANIAYVRCASFSPVSFISSASARRFPVEMTSCDDGGTSTGAKRPHCMPHMRAKIAVATPSVELRIAVAIRITGHLPSVESLRPILVGRNYHTI